MEKRETHGGIRRDIMRTDNFKIIKEILVKIEDNEHA
jgi:hypothetical protein